MHMVDSLRRQTQLVIGIRQDRAKPTSGVGWSPIRRCHGRTTTGVRPAFFTFELIPAAAFEEARFIAGAIQTRFSEVE